MASTTMGSELKEKQPERIGMKAYYVCPKCGKRIYPDPVEAVTLAGFCGNQYVQFGRVDGIRAPRPTSITCKCGGVRRINPGFDRD